MIKIIGYQLYRFFIDFRKFIFVMVLLCLNIMTMFFVGKYGAARQSGEIFGDYHPQARVGIKYTVNSAAEFYDNIAFVCENAEKNKEQSGEIFGSYQENLLKIYKDLHNSAEISDSDFSETKYFQHDYSVIFIAAAALLFSITIYGEDISLGIMPIIRTTKNGRIKLALAKQLSVLLFVFFSVILFLSSELIVYGKELIFGAPVQSLPEMALCPYNIKVYQYLIIYFCTKFVFAAVFTLICNLIICASASVIKSCLAAICLSAMSWAASLVRITSIFSPLNYISIYKMSTAKPLFSQYRPVVTGGKLYPAVPVVFIVYAIIGVLSFAAGIYLSSSRRTKIIPEKQKRILFFKVPVFNYTSKKPKSYSMSIWICEFNKCIVLSGAFLIILAAFAVNIIINITGGTGGAYSVSELIYHEYMTYYSGDAFENSLWTELKAEDVLATARELDIKKELRRAAENDFIFGKLTPEEYDDILAQCGDAEIRRNVFTRIEKYEEYLSKTKNVSFVYDTGWNKVFGRDIDIPVYIAVLLLAASVFAIEHDRKTSSYGMDVILKTTKFGRGKTYISKLSVLTVCCLVVSVISEMISILFIMRHYELPLLNAAAKSLMIFSRLPQQFSIFGIFVTNELARVLSLLLFAIITAGIAEITEKRLGIIISGLFILILPKLTSIDVTTITSGYFIVYEIMLLIAASAALAVSKFKWNNYGGI